jgi:glucose/arabinose dehydrogenase
VIQENVGERIRDLDVAPDGQLVGTTDSGALLFFSLNSN